MPTLQPDEADNTILADPILSTEVCCFEQCWLCLTHVNLSSQLEMKLDNGAISPLIQSTNRSRVPSSGPGTDVRPEGKDTRSNAEHKVERK